MSFQAHAGLTERHGTGTASTNNASPRAPSPDQPINFIYDVSEFVISICGGQFQLQDESVDLVDAHGHCQPLLHRVLDQPLRVQHHLRGTASSEPQESLHKMLSGA